MYFVTINEKESIWRENEQHKHRFLLPVGTLLTPNSSKPSSGFDSKCFNTKNNCYIKSNSKQIITQTTFIIKHDFLLNFKLLNKFCGWPIFKAKKCHSWHFLTLTQLSPRLMVFIYTESKLIDNWLRCRFFFLIYWKSI